MADLDDARSLAAKVAARANLRDVRLFSVEAALDQLPEGAQRLSYSFEVKIEVQHLPETATLLVDGRYALVVRNMEHEDAGGESSQSEASERDHLAQLTFQLAALYSVDDDGAGFPERELDAFGETTGLLTLHPYAREFVANMTGRMGLPALHLESVAISLDKRNSDHAG
jgi:hypothetical protein